MYFGIMFIYDLIERNITASTLNDLLQRQVQNQHNLTQKDYLNIPLVTRNYLYSNPFLFMCRNFNEVSTIYHECNNRKQFKLAIENLPDMHFNSDNSVNKKEMK